MSTAIASIWLATDWSVSKYKTAERAQDAEGIACFFAQRVTERYIDPILNSKSRNGFATMAICCLLIETLQQFYNGIPKTEWKEGAASFEEFFERTSGFESLHSKGEAFHANVRCGILHQGETKGGWTIGNSGPLFDGATHINANEFFDHMRGAIDAYRDELKAADWNATVWQNFRRKMGYVCENCEPSSPSL